MLHIGAGTAVLLLIVYCVYNLIEAKQERERMGRRAEREARKDLW